MSPVDLYAGSLPQWRAEVSPLFHLILNVYYYNFSVISCVYVSYNPPGSVSALPTPQQIRDTVGTLLLCPSDITQCCWLLERAEGAVGRTHLSVSLGL